MGTVELAKGTWEVFAGQWRFLHGYDPRLSPQPARGWVRLSFRVGQFLRRFRIQSVTIMIFGLVLGALVPVLARKGGGWTMWAALALLVAATCGLVNRAIAILADDHSRLGDVYSALIDRLMEVGWLLALWFLGAPAGLLVACLGVTWLYEFVRSKAAEVGAAVLAGELAAERGIRACITATGLVACGMSSLIADAFASATATLAAAIWLLLTVFAFARLIAAVNKAVP